MKYRKRSIEGLDLKYDSRILISGAGTGLDLNFLDKSQHIAAIDITPGMINRLSGRANKLALKVDARTGDAQNLPFPDDFFDAVILHLIIAVIPDPYKCLQEAERVVKPGGKITVMDKFLPKGENPSVLRKILNAFTNLLATEINRDFAAIAASTQLNIIRDIPIAAGGNFRIILLQKPE